MEIQIFGDGHDGEVRKLREENERLRAQRDAAVALLQQVVLIVDECGLPIDPKLRAKVSATLCSGG